MAGTSNIINLTKDLSLNDNKSKKTRDTAKKDEEIRLKLICDYVNNNTALGIKIKEDYKKIFNKEIKEMKITAKLKDHYDILITHTDETTKKCEEKGTKTYHPNINQIETKPWQFSVQLLNGPGNHYNTGRMYSRIWYNHNVFPGEVNKIYNIKEAIPSYKEWSKDAFALDKPKTNYGKELKKNFQEIHGPTSMNGKSKKDFKPNTFNYKTSVNKEFRNNYTNKIKKKFIQEVQNKINNIFEEKECYLQTTGDIETNNFSFKWFDKIESPKIIDIILKDTGSDLTFDVITDNNSNNYSIIIRFGHGFGFTNIRVDFK